MKAECTWGDGPDVTLSLDGTKMVLRVDPAELDKWVHGTVAGGQADLTSEQARDLARQLIKAADEADRLDEVAEEHDKETMRSGYGQQDVQP